MAKTYKVKNLDEALLLAQKLKKKVKYDLFRGQAQNWRVTPTLSRISNKSYAQLKEKLERLYYFFSTHSSLKKFKTDIDWFYAVAQHYGIPTNYIDFTSDIEVAAYFATNSKSNIIGTDCSIICLNESDFKSFIDFTNVLYAKDKVIPPYIARVDVDNLWRLQAQKGCFLFTPYNDIEYYYDFDKILFPFEKPFENLSKSEIYPDRKSELEILLDQYFNTEEKIKGEKRLHLFAKQLNIPITTLPPMESEKLLIQNKAHSSWKSKIFRQWIYQIKDEWQNPTQIIKAIIKISNNISNQDLIDNILKELNFLFLTQSIKRTTALQFEIISKPRVNKKLQKIINRSMTRIWDGTRNLPFTDLEIFEIIAKYVCLELKESKDKVETSQEGEKMILIEMNSDYGSRTRCYASPSNLVNAFRSDLSNVLVNSFMPTDQAEIMLHINTANLLFDFKKLLQAFKKEVIAYQVFHNSENENPVIFYSPSQLNVLGYA
jgi:FRG domain